MVLYNKIKWVLGILMVFVLIIATNLIDRNNFSRIKDSVITIYEDRLVANDLIFSLSTAVQDKEVAIAKSDSTFFLSRNAQVNLEIQGLITEFEQTKLTSKEAEVFNALKEKLDALKNSEAEFVQNKFAEKTNLTGQISKLKENLYELSKIQLGEGKREMFISKNAMDSVELFTQLEIYFLVLLAIVIQIIVIYKPKQE